MNENFKEFGYDNALFLPNTISEIVALACVLIFVVLVLCVDFIFERLQKR